MMSSNAQRDLYEDFQEQPLAATGTDGGGVALRRIAAERLAAHRNRRSINTGETASQNTASVDRHVSEAAQRVRDAVAARYRQTPSYQDILAATPPPPEPQRAAEPLTPTHIPAQPPTQTWIDEPLVPVEPVAHVQSFLDETLVAEPVDDFFTDATASFDSANLEVRPYSDLPLPAPLPERAQDSLMVHPDEMQGLDEEIAFRLAPEFNEHLIEPLPIQANIIEFPRQLVAARKQRPRLAEGPLRSNDASEYRDAPAVPEPSLFDPAPPHAASASEFQLRIFEVDPRDADWSTSSPAESISEPAIQPPAEHAAPEWQNLVLDAHQHEYTAQAEPTQQSYTRQATASPATDLAAPPVARFELRLMSALVDAACIGMAFVVFSTVTALTTSHALEGLAFPLIVAAAVALLVVLTVLYQVMFFTLGASTPGMYYAHLEFRTLAGRQPSRGLLRRRVPANILAAAPAGLGLLWSLVDGRSLGWNDRLSGVFLQEL